MKQKLLNDLRFDVFVNKLLRSAMRMGEIIGDKPKVETEVVWYATHASITLRVFLCHLKDTGAFSPGERTREHMTLQSAFSQGERISAGYCSVSKSLITDTGRGL